MLALSALNVGYCLLDVVHFRLQSAKRATEIRNPSESGGEVKYVLRDAVILPVSCANKQTNE
jgi:hypothetical protein